MTAPDYEALVEAHRKLIQEVRNIDNVHPRLQLIECNGTPAPAAFHLRAMNKHISNEVQHTIRTR